MPETTADEKSREMTSQKLDEMGDTWKIQDEQIERLDPLKYSSWPWIVLKAVFGTIIITTIYLLYGLAEIPWTLAESFVGMMIFGFVPFFVAFVLGMTFESGKKALAFAFTIGMISIGIMFIIIEMPFKMGLFEFGEGYTMQLWWHVLLCFICMISFVPVAAVLASSTNVYE